MLEKAGSKLYLAGEYAILKENSYAIVSYIEKYTYLYFYKNEEWEVTTSIKDKDGLIYKIIEYVERNFDISNKAKLKYESELYENDKKYGLGSSASLIVVTIKSILKLNNIVLDSMELFNVCIDFMIENNISGSFGDVACICYEKNILFKSSNRIDRNYEIKVLDVETNLDISAIWTKSPAKSSKLISKININNKFFEEFRMKSNDSVLKIYKAILVNDVDVVLENIDKLNDNLHDLEKNNEAAIHTDIIENMLSQYRYSKISGAGGGDFILSFSKSSIFNKLNVDLIY
ncbi:hypothetical protein HP397_04935 [Streptobacillus felis]|uniref:GHMP kinase N-terminal domain-containing protein n=1 Tax=Streptobacillus felis TaxID=1384509 RepID=A0A7Z0PF67_9FUSO|nr:hypothetical protein [Streptobacillus felis]NYV28149.1 hypothetical protein [Streptobacillus felis]